MGTINNLFRTIIAIMVFCLGIFILFHESKVFMSSVNTSRQRMKDEVVYQQYNIADKGSIPYEELIASLLQPLDYDMMVNGRRVTTLDHSPEKISEYAIPKRVYRKTYQYDEKGNVIFIIYE